MKFDVVVGNPPYQENDNGKRDNGSANASASPIYPLFIDLAKKISPVQSMIMPARWTTGAGKGLGKFSKEMLSDKHFKSFSLFTNASDVFPNTDIKGGVTFFVRDANYTGPSKINIIEPNERNERTGYLDEDNLGILIKYNDLKSIYEKVNSITNLRNSNMQSIVSGRKPYGLTTDFFSKESKNKKNGISSKNSNSNDDLRIVGLQRGKRSFRFLPKNYPLLNGLDTIYKYKVFVPYAYGSGNFGEKMPNLIIGGIGDIATETFLRIGNFSYKEEAVALKKYMSTKFFRALIGLLKVTQHSTITYRLVPLQNFTNSSDINWVRTVDEIDKQLYKKYKLSEQEIAFIENRVLPMD